MRVCMCVGFILCRSRECGLHPDEVLGWMLNARPDGVHVYLAISMKVQKAKVAPTWSVRPNAGRMAFMCVGLIRCKDIVMAAPRWSARQDADCKALAVFMGQSGSWHLQIFTGFSQEV